ncbi:1,2-dihydroxy-3-keto-5-methylthiopentene dioxygenase [Coemansia sp. RSA 2618]|nr:1,2-dihydroxy-3-keto-5-methylthiopentene dioxygenase [Coemansia sp. RSA 2618]
MEWEIERVRLKAKISASEKRIAQLSTLYTGSQKRVAMLEAVLRGGATDEYAHSSNVADSAKGSHSLKSPADPAAKGDASRAREPGSLTAQDLTNDIVEATRGTRERGRKLLEQCLEEIDALANGVVDMQPADIAAMPLDTARRGELGGLGVADRAKKEKGDEPRLNGIIESDAGAGEPLSMVASAQAERRPIRRISEQRRRRASLTVDEVDAGAAWRAGRVLLGHMDCVRAVHAQHDVVASAGDDGLVVLWDLAQRPQRARSQALARDVVPISVCRGHRAAATSVVLGTDCVFAGGLDSSVRAWALPAAGAGDDVAGVFPAREFAGHSDAVWGLALAPRVSLLASVSADATCRLWSVDARMGAAPLRATLTNGARVPTCVCFAGDDGAQLAVGYDSGLVDVRDLATGNTAVTFDAESRVTQVARHNAIYAVASVGGTVHLCDTRTGKSVLGAGISAYPQPGVAATAVDISADAAVVTGGSDGVVKWWDWRKPLANVCEAHAHQQKGDEGVCAVAYTANGVLSAGADGLIKLFQQE